MTERLPGSCLCGACAFTAIPKGKADVCHCRMCQKWSGGMFIGVECGETVAFADGAPVERFRSSDWAHRLFCRACGSALAWQSDDGKMTVVSIQCFEDPGQFPVESEIFYDSKPGNYALANETHKMTGAEVMALFAPDPAPQAEAE